MAKLTLEISDLEGGLISVTVKSDPPNIDNVPITPAMMIMAELLSAFFGEDGEAKTPTNKRTVN